MYQTGKRVLDLLLSAVLLIVLSPLLFLIMLCLAFTPSGQVFFVQTRVGRNGRLFSIVKFCTMRPDAPHRVATRDLPSPEQWITPIGRWLRVTSLDELPQLWNVLKGDMSLVGPRPVIPEETELLRERRRLGADTCRPGITGLAQVRGRDRLGTAEKARRDAEYARRISFALDLRIVWETLRCVIRRENVTDLAGREKKPRSALRWDLTTEKK